MHPERDTYNCIVQEDVIVGGTLALVIPSTRPSQRVDPIGSKCVVDGGHRNGRAIPDGTCPSVLHNECIKVERRESSTTSAVDKLGCVSAGGKAADGGQVSAVNRSGRKRVESSNPLPIDTKFKCTMIGGSGSNNCDSSACNRLV